MTDTTIKVPRPFICNHWGRHGADLQQVALLLRFGQSVIASSLPRVTFQRHIKTEAFSLVHQKACVTIAMHKVQYSTTV
jgi:hypothetical protein